MSRPPKNSGRPDGERGQSAPEPGVAEHARPADLFPDDRAAVHTELLGAEPEAEADGADEGEVHRPLTDARLRSVLESVLFAADRPLSPQRIHELLEETASPPGRSGERSGPPLYQPARIAATLDALAADYQAAGRGIELHNVAGGYQFRTAPQNAPWVQRLLQAKPVRLSRAQLETLSIVAYRQPITRPEIDDIRGVDSGGSLKTLLERQMVRVLGKKEEPGRPLLYGTTREFLEFFNLRDLKDLPTLREYYDLTDESKAKVRSELGDEALQMPLGTAGPPAAPGAAPATPGAAPAAPGAAPAAPDATAATTPGAGDAAPPAPGAPAAPAETPVGAPLPARELIDRQLADDAEQLAKIDELIRAVNTDFALMDLGAPQPGGVPGMPGVPAGAARPPAGVPVRSDDDDEPDDDRAELAAQSLRDEDDREPEEL